MHFARGCSPSHGIYGSIDCDRGADGAPCKRRPTWINAQAVHSTVTHLAVREAFFLLSENHRDVLALVDIGGLTYDETAELLRIKRGTVMSRVSRARAALAEKLSGPHVVELPRKGKGMRRG